ncbi:50S ribosomal protein L11 methyltransferase [Epibacterium ulvae]|uniref:50S ribosomal protein L11 methyltransferase n=1 Tax=Epibacterium ulvae TaxID=1156985 RepID=UPI003CD0DB3D
MPQIRMPNASCAVSEPTAQDVETLVQLAKSQSLEDGGIATANLLKQALTLDPSHHEAQLLQDRLHHSFVPRWHYPMMADTARNEAYTAAIQAKVRPGDIVLDIGCGAGLTAMMAARAGAKHVYTCEQQPLIAQAARKVIADNGLSDRITVLSKWSHEIVIGTDMPEPADVVLSEIVDTMLLGEGALATLTHAMAALAKPGARTIPERGRLMVQPVESHRLAHQMRPQQAEGFDLSAFHRFAKVAQITPNDCAAYNLRALGPALDLFGFDFTRPSLESARQSADVLITRTGKFHAVCVSFEMELAPGISVTNDLGSDGHWGRTAFLLDQPKRVQPGDMMRVTAQHDTSALSLALHENTLQHATSDGAVLWVQKDWAETEPNLSKDLPEDAAIWSQAQAAPSRPSHHN